MAKKDELKEENKKENKNRHEVNVKITGDDWNKALDKIFTKKQKTAQVDGFRKGKVPRDVYEKKFGKESLYLDAADEVLPDAYQKAMDDSKLEPVAQPEVNLKSIGEDGVEFTFKIITKPEVKVNKYKGLNIKPEKVEVSEDEINHELGHLLERYTELVPKEGSAEKGNVVIIDFEGFKDGVAFEGGKAENYSLELGSNSFIPGFEDQIIGMKAGDEKELNLTFPEDYNVKDLAGAPVVFKVKVNEVKEKKQRELDADFFDDLGMEGIDSEEKLRNEIKESIKAQKEMDAENKYVDALLEGVSKNVDVDIPEEMVNEEVDRLMDRFQQQMKMQGLSLDMYYQFTGTDEKQLRSQLEKEAFNNVLYRLMIDEIKVMEKVVISEEEADKEALELAKKYNMEKDEFLKQFGGIDAVKYDLEVRKVIDLLKEYNK